MQYFVIADNILGYSKGINTQINVLHGLTVIHEIRVGQIHRRPTRPKIRVRLVLHVLHGSGAYDRCISFVLVLSVL